MTHVLQNHTHSPLIGIMLEENGHEVVRYFTEEKAADAAVSHNATQKALDVIGAWRDLDWNETVHAFDKIRHESKPTPPNSYFLFPDTHGFWATEVRNGS